MGASRRHQPEGRRRAVGRPGGLGAPRGHLDLEHHHYTWCDAQDDLAGRLRAATGDSYYAADHRLVAPNLAVVSGLYGRVPRRPEDAVMSELGRSNWLVPDLIDYLWRDATLIDAGAAVLD